MSCYSLLVLPGDGIGPEVLAQAHKLAKWFSVRGNIEFIWQEDLVGGAAIDRHGVPLAAETLEKARGADAILLGAVGGPKWDDIEFERRPEAGLLALRKELDLFANLRPALVFPALVEASSLKPEIVSGLDILIVRELTGGVYFGEPRGITTLPDGQRQGVNTQRYTSKEIERVAALAFELARLRNNHVTSVEKANVMESGKLWREDVTALHQKNYKNIKLDHMYADNCAMQLVRNPRQFDVIVTDNLFGDMLSDEAAMLTGSLGMLPSASLGARSEGRVLALYEPVHGSAPDIAGQNKANPLAMCLSFAMMLRYSFEEIEAANLVEAAVNKVLEQKLRTADIMAPDCRQVSTDEMGDALVTMLDKLSG